MRPWRNNNPGDLRTLPPPEQWDGQVAIDDSPGGPFAIFASRVMGWRALGVCLLTYQRSHGLRTVAQIIGRWAPPADNNNTDSYVNFVCDHMGVTPNAPLDLGNAEVLQDLAEAIADQEGGLQIVWPENEISAGVRLALV